MEFRQLRYFLCVLKHGSINRAAVALNVTQPSLSHSIKALETSVGARLLLRGGGGVRATPIGEVFERYATNIIREAEKALGEVSALRSGGRTRVSVGVMSVFSLKFAPRIISQFVVENPSVEIDIASFTSKSEQVIQRLQAAEWDLALTLLPDDFVCPPDMACRQLGTAHSHVYARADHPLVNRQDVSLRDMAAFPWAVTNIGSSEQLLNETFATQDLAPDIRVRTNDINQVLSLAYTHPFLCLLPAQTIAEDVASGQMVRIDQSFLHTQASIAILYSNLAERTVGMRNFIRLCAEETAAAAAHIPRPRTPREAGQIH
ncbi:MAG TPA: LysR family transcriptional regulator [Novosphingobium sp.]|nr:LysR family transcriptional regulator [Novosphingobium sp.]